MFNAHQKIKIKLYANQNIMFNTHPKKKKIIWVLSNIVSIFSIYENKNIIFNPPKKEKKITCK
jgi:hypothetical protein